MSIAILQSHGFTTSSFSRAVQEFAGRELNLDQINMLIREIAPAAPTFDDLQLGHYVASYLIQDIVRRQLTHAPSEDDLNQALKAAANLKRTSYNGVVFGDEVTVTVEDENGDMVRVVKKRAKRTEGGETAQDRARKLFDANPSLTRREMMAKFVAELGISTNTAATYFAAFNKTAKRATGGKKGLRREGISREEQVRAVYESRTEWSDRKEFVQAIVDAVGCSAASANTYSYKMMPSAGRGKKVAAAAEPKKVTPTKKADPAKKKVARGKKGA